MFRFTSEQKKFIRTPIQGRFVPELINLFNTGFAAEIKPSQIRTFIKNNSLKSGIDSRIKPGNVPFNKGKKKTWVGDEATQSARVTSHTIMFL